LKTARRKRSRLRKALLAIIAGLIGPPLLYAIAGFGLALIPVNGDYTEPAEGIDVFLISNGVHVDFVLPAETGAMQWTGELPPPESAGPIGRRSHVVLGWGNRRFYLETPTWGDLKLSTAIEAVLLPGRTVMHVDYLQGPPVPGDSCRRIRLGADAYSKLCAYLKESFRRDADGRPILIPGEGYGDSDSFYEAEGKYHAFMTCNSWTRRGLAACGAPAPLWSPFAWGVMRHLPRPETR
jgi:uncharacterized protein (TIGR02117 family)